MGVFCVPLAAIGLLGALLYSVRVRTREIAIRIARGAEPSRVKYTVVRRALVIVSLGLLLGVGLGVAAGRLAPSQLFNVRPADALTIVGVSASLLLLAWLAALLRRGKLRGPSQRLR